jgi:superfamily II RNA helicase
LTGFLQYVEGLGLTLYSHQEEAVLAVMADSNVIVHTPTGSDKTLIASAVHFKALAEGRRSFYTCPIKALVSEKFFDLCRELGPDRVGMMTGDATVNRDAPVICCTAEILANIALAEGQDADVDYVVMDEFHYFSDKERGVAWQVPLLTLWRSRFVLMSATLGDVSAFETLLEKHTGEAVVTVHSAQRPVPLHFEYQEKLLQEAVLTLVEGGRGPVYIVNFTQRGAAEAAQSLLSVDFATKDEKRALAEAIPGVHIFTSIASGGEPPERAVTEPGHALTRSRVAGTSEPVLVDVEGVTTVIVGSTLREAIRIQVLGERANFAP